MEWCNKSSKREISILLMEIIGLISTATCNGFMLVRLDYVIENNSSMTSNKGIWHISLTNIRNPADAVLGNAHCYRIVP